MNRRLRPSWRSGIVLVVAAAVVAAGARATLGALSSDDVISACRNKSTGVLRVPSAGSSCKADEQPLQWNIRGVAGPQGPPGPTGPQGPAGPVSVSALANTGCTTAAGLYGTLRVLTDANGNVTFNCRATADPEALPQVVLNEIDYDQPGTDSGGFVELFNAGRGTADLQGLALVFINGADGTEYLRIPLNGSILAHDFRVIPVDAQNGFPDGVALFDTIAGEVVDALSYEGPIERAFIGSFAYSLVEGTALPESVADSDTRDGSLAREPNGSDTNDAASDWVFTTTVTEGGPNFASG
jgi:hypothetical protein